MLAEKGHAFWHTKGQLSRSCKQVMPTTSQDGLQTAQQCFKKVYLWAYAPVDMTFAKAPGDGVTVIIIGDASELLDFETFLDLLSKNRRPGFEAEPHRRHCPIANTKKIFFIHLIGHTSTVNPCLSHETTPAQDNTAHGRWNPNSGSLQAWGRLDS